MGSFQAIILLILGNIIVGALFTSVEIGIAELILIIGLILVDIFAIYGYLTKKF